jgi:uncharacterized protein YigE (DUF2233 family)
MERSMPLARKLFHHGLRAMSLALGVLLAAPADAAEPDVAHCAEQTVRDIPYVICRFDPKTDDIRLFHANAEGEPFSHFNKLRAPLEENGERLVFAMNAGMFMANRAPVGLYIEDGVTRRPVNNRNCKGNFCLKPNGIFWLWAEDGFRGAHVTPTGKWVDPGVVSHATQSGPMLVIDGELHPKFRKDSTSVHRRNGVGVTKDGKVVFAISDEAVTFHEFATLFRDDLKAPNALYLDGAISRLYSAELNRNEPGAAMGPIVGVVEKAPVLK